MESDYWWYNSYRDAVESTAQVGSKEKFWMGLHLAAGTEEIA